MLQILIAARRNTGLAFGIGAVLTFLFLLCLYNFGQVIAVLLTERAADFPVLPEKALPAVVRPICVIADAVDHSGFSL